MLRKWTYYPTAPTNKVCIARWTFVTYDNPVVLHPSDVSKIHRCRGTFSAARFMEALGLTAWHCNEHWERGKREGKRSAQCIVPPHLYKLPKLPYKDADIFRSLTRRRNCIDPPPRSGRKKALSSDKWGVRLLFTIILPFLWLVEWLWPWCVSQVVRSFIHKTFYYKIVPHSWPYKFMFESLNKTSFIHLIFTNRSTQGGFLSRTRSIAS